MSDLSGSIRVEPDALNSMADNIDGHATRLEHRIQETIAALERLIQGGGFEGLSAQVILWRYQQQKPTLLLWTKRIRAYAMRLRVTSEAIRQADAAGASSIHPRADSFSSLHGVNRDRGYKQLLDVEARLRLAQSERDAGAMSLMTQRMRLAELQAQLADYDEMSGGDFGARAEDASEYLAVRLDGRRSALEQEIVALQTSIAGGETKLKQAEERVSQLTADADAVSTSIRNRVQNVGGHDVLFYQQMSSKPAVQAGWCLKFVVDWRPDINAGFGSAANLITTSDTSVAPYRYTIDASTSLPDRMLPGDLVVWSRGQQGSNATHGHVAMIMEVHDSFVIVKETSWGGQADTWRQIPRSDLQNLTFVGQPTK